MSVTAKIKCTSKINGSLSFGPDYQDGRNAEWATATPAISVMMTVRPEVAEHFEVGQEFTLTFDPAD